MGKLNRDFKYHRAFNFIMFLAFIVFVTLFTKSIITVTNTNAFETEIYTTTVAELSRVNL